MSELRGTSRAYALRRLHRDAPELYAEVVAGRISPHGAMVKAGYRAKRFTIRADDPDSIVTTLQRQLPPDVLAAVAEQLAATLRRGA